MKSLIKKIQETDKIEKFYSNKMFFVAQLLIAMFLYVLDFFFKDKQQKIVENITTIFSLCLFIFLTAIILITVKNIKYSIFSFFTASLFLLKVDENNYKHILISFLAINLILLVFLILKRIMFPIKFKVGKMLFPIILFSTTIFFSGIGQVSIKTFFEYYNLFFVLGLSLAPIIAYVFLFNYLPKNQEKKENEKFLSYFMLIGVFSIFILITTSIYQHYLSIGKISLDLDNNIKNKEFLANLMMVIGVFPFYYAIKEKGFKGFLYFLYGNILFIGSIYTRSKTALFIAGVALFVMIMLSIIYTTTSNRYLYMGFLIGILFVSIFILSNSNGYLSTHIEKIKLGLNDFEKNSFLSGFNNLFNFPFSGKGIQNISVENYTNNIAFVNLFIQGGNIIQLFGAIGFIGVAGILYLLVKKFTILVKEINKLTLIILMSYIILIIASIFTNLYFMFIPFISFSILISTFIENTDFNNYNQDENKLSIYKENTMGV